MSDYLTDAQAIDTLVDTVAGGGNLLLDIGPRSDGTIPQVMRDRLKAMGAWLRINGESIYCTAPAKRRGTGTLRYTVGKDGSFYVTDEVWPGGRLVLDPPVRITARTQITLLGSQAGPLSHKIVNGRLVITTPADGDQVKATTSRNAFVFKIRDPAAATVGCSATDEH